MSENPTYKLVQIVGTSNASIDDAVQSGVKKASSSLHNVDWFQVDEIRGRVVDGTAEQFQVIMRVGFRLDDGS